MRNIKIKLEEPAWFSLMMILSTLIGVSLVLIAIIGIMFFGIDLSLLAIFGFFILLFFYGFMVLIYIIDKFYNFEED